MSSDLRDKIQELAPWHLEVEVAPGITTKGDASPTTNGVTLISPREDFRNLMLSIFPDGLESRSFLDCACNCGGYSFWAREMGAGRCFGFDVREHWITQAQFLQRHRGETGMEFRLCDLYDLELDEPFDVTLFKGIFYHLPDPISGLKIAADLTKELLVLNTATHNDYQEEALVVAREDVENSMAGVHGLNWFPGGPKAVREILDWLAFPETRVRYWLKDAPHQPQSLGRMEIIAARDPAALAYFRE